MALERLSAGGGPLARPDQIGSLGMPGAPAADRPTIAGGVPVPVPPNTVPPYTAPPAQTFGGHAPTPTAYGSFAGLDPSTFNRSADSLYLQGQQQNAIQRGAAAHGTLLTGGLQKRLQENAEGLASQDFGNAFSRSLQTYDTNRATNAQNFGQSMDQYNGSLAGFNANTNAASVYGHLGLDAQQNAYGQGRQTALDTQGYGQATNDYNAQRASDFQAASDDAYARQVAATRAQNAATAGMSGNGRIAAPIGGLSAVPTVRGFRG